MKTVHHSSSLTSTLTLLLSALISLALSATLPASQAINQSPEPSNSTLGSKSSVHCTPTMPLSPFFMTMHDCAEAINLISDNQNSGNFHTGDPFDQWSLPITKTAKWCKIKVEMADLGVSDSSSWLQVNLAATRLNLQCWSRYKYRYQGGWTNVGTANGIKVSLIWYSMEGTRRNETELLEAFEQASSSA